LSNGDVPTEDVSTGGKAYYQDVVVVFVVVVAAAASAGMVPLWENGPPMLEALPGLEFRV
jgi:hypothetical protein